MTSKNLVFSRTSRVSGLPGSRVMEKAHAESTEIGGFDERGGSSKGCFKNLNGYRGVIMLKNSLRL